MNHLLVIAYYFPPAAVVGTNRIARFAKYLPLHGWETTVITVKEKYYDLQDETIGQGITGNCQIIRTGMTEFSKVHRKYIITKEGGYRATGLMHKEKINPARRFLQTYLSIPDTRAGWIPKAVTESLKVIHENKIDAVLTTSFPYSAHIIGLLLKSLKGLFWLADFRDPWAEYAFLYPDTKLHKKASQYLESKVIESADIVIANTPFARGRFAERYSQYSEKIKSIPNGYDQQEIDRLSISHNYETDSSFVILHAGTIQSEKGRRYPEIFFMAISHFIENYPETRSRLRIRFIGHIHFNSDLEELARQYGIESNLELVGWVNHEKALVEMASASVLLLIHHSHQDIPKLFSTVPAKTYEYFAMKKPILCLTANGAVGRLITETQTGISVEPTNAAELVNAIESLYFHYEEWRVKLGKNSHHESYEARLLTAELYKLLPKKEQFQ